MVDTDTAYDQRYNLGDEEMAHVAHSLQSYQAVRDCKRPADAIFFDLPVNSHSITLLPLIVLLERHHSKQCYLRLYRLFDHWKAASYQRSMAFPSTPVLQFDQLYESDSVSPVYFEQLDVIQNNRLAKALDVMLAHSMRLRAMQDKPTLAAVWKRFHHWRQWAIGCERVGRAVPIPLRILVMLQHQVLWRIFHSYSYKRQKLSKSLGRSQPLAVVVHSPTASPLSSPVSSPSAAGLRTFSDDGEPASPLMTEVSFVPSKAYHQRLLHMDEAWTLLRDCALAPLHIGRRKFEHLLEVIRSSADSGCPTGMYVESRSPPGRGTPKKRAADPFRSPAAYRKPAVFSAPGTPKVAASSSKEGEEVFLSFDTFLKLLWMLVAELVEVAETDIGAHIPAIRQVLKALENKSMAMTLKMISTTSGGWKKFTAQYAAKNAAAHHH